MQSLDFRILIKTTKLHDHAKPNKADYSPLNLTALCGPEWIILVNKASWNSTLQGLLREETLPSREQS